MFHSGCVDNDNSTRNTIHVHYGSDSNTDHSGFNPREGLLHLDTQLAGVGLGPRRAPLRPVELATGEEHVKHADPALYADRRESDDRECLPERRCLERSRSPFANRPFPPSPPATPPLTTLRSVSPAETRTSAPSATQTFPIRYNPEPPEHKLKSYIPIPTPFEYADEDGDDFRGDFDFDRAWAGSTVSDPDSLTTQQLDGSTCQGSQELVESPQTDSSPGLSSSPSSTGSGTSCGTILTPKSPYEDQEYYDIMYKLDLGAESPYLGSAYVEAFGTHGSLLTQPPPPRPASPKARVRDSTDSSLTSSSVDAITSKRDTHCGICLRKALAPCRTKCCDRTFCRAHISDWLKSKESSGLCPSCDAVCVLADESSSPTGSKKPRGSSRSQSPSPSRRSSSTSTSSTASASSLGSGTSTRVNTRSSSSSSAALTLIDGRTPDEEAEDLWDAKSAWKKNGGGSVDFVEMARDVVGDVVSGSMKFVGLSGGRPGPATGGHRTPAAPLASAIVEKGLELSPIQGEFTLKLDEDEMGEGGFAKRMISILGLVIVLFVLFR